MNSKSMHENSDQRETRIKRLSEQKHARIPRLEFYFYCLCWLFFGCVGCYEVFRVSRKFRGNLNGGDFTSGWIPGHRKDISNFEWSFWSHWFVKLLPWIFGHSAISRLLSWKLPEMRQQVFLLYSLMALGNVLGSKGVGVLIVHGFVSFFVALPGYKGLVWLINLTFLSSLNFPQFAQILKQLVEPDPDEMHYYLLIFSISMTNIRVTSFCLEKCDSTRQSNQYGVVNLLLYVLYLPVFFTGPILTYDKFIYEINKPQVPMTKQMLKTFIFGVLRIAFWVLFIEILLHFFYFNALQLDAVVMGRISVWAVGGIGYWLGQFFMLKYVIFFGIPKVVAILDNIDVHDGPVCISRVTRYSQMWKKFDRGLYSFLKRHIYIPCVYISGNWAMNLFAKALCFLYIFYWHGAEDYLFMWTSLNYLGIVLEDFAQRLYRNKTFRSLYDRCLRPLNQRRFEAALTAPLLMMSFISIFYFFCGMTIGKLFARRLLAEYFPKAWILLFAVLYPVAQVSMEIENKEIDQEIAKLEEKEN